MTDLESVGSGQGAARREGPDPLDTPVTRGDEVIVQHGRGVTITGQETQPLAEGRAAAAAKQAVHTVLG